MFSNVPFGYSAFPEIKKRWKLIFIFIVLGFPGNLKGADVEVWTFAGFEKEWKNANLSFQNANFFTDQPSWYLNNTQITFDLQTIKNVYFGVGYKQEYVKLTDRMRKEYRPMLRLLYQKSMGDFTFVERNTLEFRYIENEWINRYRNQLMLLYKKQKNFTPYISTEFFFKVRNFGYSRQRTLLGAFIPIKKISLNLFVAHQISELQPRWSEKIMLGTGLNYNF